MKKIVAFFLLATLMTCVLFGCKKKDSAPKTNASVSSSSENSSNNSQNNTSNREESTFQPSVQGDGKRPEKILKTYELREDNTVPEYQKLFYEDKASGKKMPYSLYLPEDYSKEKKYPLILILHGMGSGGTNHSSATSYLSSMYTNNGDIVKNAIILAPQCADYDGWWLIDDTDGENNGWGAVAMRLVENIQKKYSVDSDRLYIMGVSMGGIGTWTLLSEYNDRFAAGVPICGLGTPTDAIKLKNIPIWIYHGDADTIVGVNFSDMMYNAITKLGGEKIHFTRLEGVGHNSWTYAFADRELFNWLFSQNKKTNPEGLSGNVPYFKVVDYAGNVVISEKDATAVSLESVGEEEQLEFTLTNEGVEKLNTAYLNSSGKTFSAYCGSVKLMDFTATTSPIDNKFVIPKVFNTYNYWPYFDKISGLLP